MVGGLLNLVVKVTGKSVFLVICMLCVYELFSSEMQPLLCSRIDLGILKAQIAKRIGSERSKRYFFYLNKFLSQRLGKSELDKVCYRVLGRENLPIHNHLIWSILKNVYQAKTPPPVHEADCGDYGHERSLSVAPNQNHGGPIWSNGVLPASPQKCRSGIRDRKLKDRPRPLGPNGRVEFVSHQSTGTEDSGSKLIIEIGELALCDYQKPIQHVQAVSKQTDIETEGSVQRSIEKPRICSKYQNEDVEDEDEDEEVIEQANHLHFLKSPLLAPLGVPFCSASAGGPGRALPVASGSQYVSFTDNGGLSDTETLMKHMEQIAAAQGLAGGVSTESANLLNGMLDVYLKQLIRSCVELVGARSIPEPRQYHVQKVVNGMWPSNQSTDGYMEAIQGQRPRHTVSLLDFKVAMALNPQQLGEDWPLLLEKISTCAFQE